MKKLSYRVVLFVLFFTSVTVSYIVDFEPGVAIGGNFFSYIFQLMKILPVVFILIGLFDVWIKRETIEKHLGKDGGIKSYFWVFILAAPMACGLLPALPIGYELHKKGARFSVILAFLGAVGIGRVPMILFESTFLGWEFSAIRLSISIPLVIITSIIVGRYLDGIEYELPEESNK